MKNHLSAVIVFAVLGGVMAGCSAATDDPPADASPTGAVPEVESSAEFSDEAVAPGASDAADSPALAADDDAYCQLAIDNVQVSEEVAEAASSAATLMSQDIATINSWGEELAANSTEVLTFYSDGPALVDDPATAQALETMEGFITTYTIPLAQAAAEADSVADMTSTIGAIVMDSEIQSVLTTAPAAATTIHDYTVERCGAIAP